MQRHLSDIVEDIDFLAHGLSYRVAADSAASGRRRTQTAGGEREILSSMAQIGMLLADLEDEGANRAETRAAWLRRQQDLIESLAAEITRNALDACGALHLAETNANVSAMCEHRDAELRRLLSELTRCGEQLQSRLARDRSGIGPGVGEFTGALESGPPGDALPAPGK